LHLSIPGSAQNVSALWKLWDEINIHVRCLNSLGVTSDQLGVILTLLILSRLPQDIRLEWARKSKNNLINKDNIHKKRTKKKTSISCWLS
jgi:hypothetical protein